MIVGSLEIQLMAGIARLQRDMSAARQTVSSATASMERAANAAKAALAAIGAGLAGGAGLAQIVRMTDEYTKFTAQLKLGTNSQKEYVRAMEDVKRISTAAQNDMGTTGVLYARIIASTRDLGVTQSQVAKVTETVNLALAATGASSSESASAMLQLSQAFGSGVLRGEEFNAVYEAAPELLRILARSLDIPIGRLRKLAEEGALTSDKLVKAFADDRVIAQLRENVAQITTFSGAMTVFRNNLVEVIGQQLHASGVVTAFTSAILTGAGAIKNMIDVLVTAAKVAAAYVALLVIAPPLITATAAAMTRLGHAMAVYAMNVMIGQANTIKFNQALFGTSVAAGLAAGAITRVGLALNSVFALYLGWQIGKYLNDQFVEVEVAGEIMAGGLLEGWEYVKFGAKVAADGMTVFMREAIATITKGFANWFEFVAKGFRLIGDDRMADEIVAYADKIRVATEVSGTFAGRTAEARAEMEKNIKVIDQDTDRRIAAAFAADREGVKLTAAAEARVKAGGAVTTMTEEQKKAYESAVKSANDYIESLKRERQELGLDDDQLRMLNASRAAALAPTAELRREIMEGALALTQEKHAVEAAKLAREQYENAIKAEADARAQEQSSLQDSIDRMRTEIDTYGMGAAAITRYNLAKLEARRADLIAADNYGSEMLAVMDSIDKLTQLEGLQNVRDDLDSLFETGRVETFGQALRSAFGSAGSALGELTGAFKDYSDKQTAAEMARAKVRLKYGDDEKRIAREVGKINALEERDRVSAYADMAGAAKGFFKENSAGYKVMETAERAYRAIELANQMQSLYTHMFVTTAKATGTAAGQATETAAVVAGEAARNTAKVPGVFMAFMSALGPWGMAAAGVAIAAVLGGGFSGGKGNVDMRAEAVQKRQGTGSVFGGAADDKADSIAKSLELLEENSDMLLPLTQNMLTSLRGIEAAMGGLANLVVRSAGITTGEGLGIQTGTSDPGGLAGLAISTSKLFGGLGPMGDIMGGLARAIFGSVKKDITDSGIMFGGLVRDLQAGAGYQQYANVTTTKKSLFGLSKSTKDSVQTGALDNDLAGQLGLVFQNLEKTLASSAPALDRDAAAVGEAVRNVRLDITKLSLMDLKGDELTAAINAVISKASDDVAMAALPGLDAFRQVGEGYTETIVRVASGIERAEYELERLGVAAVKYVDVANKQGDVAAEIVRQSILAAEGMAGVRDIMATLSGSATELAATYAQLRDAQDAMRMVGLDPAGLGIGLLRGAGGLDPLQGALEDYFDGFFTEAEQVAAQTESMGRKFAALGLTMPASNEAFRALVESTPALRGQLLLLAGSFADLTEATSGLSNAAEIAAAKRDLELQIMRLQGNEAGAIAIERAAELKGMHDSLRPLQERVYALQDEAAALETARSLLDIQAQIYEITGDKAAAAAVLAQQQASALAALNPALRGATLQLWGLQAAAEATEQAAAAAAAAATALKDNAAALMGGVDGAFSVLQRVVDRQKKALQDEIAIRTKSIQAIQSLSQALNGALDGMSPAGFEAEDRRAAQIEIQRALAIAKASGVLPDAEALKGALSVLGKDSAGQFTTREDYLRDFYRTRQGIEDLAGLTDDALSVEERNLKHLEDQVKQLDLMLEREQEQIDILKGISVTGISIEQALQALRGAILAATANPVNSAGSAISDTYKSALGRAPDQAGLNFWKDRAAEGISVDTIVGAIKGSPEAQVQKLYREIFGRPADAGGLQFWVDQMNKGMSASTVRDAMMGSDEKLGRIPGFMSGGDHAGGWRIVGENGPELEATGPSRIFNAGQTRDLMSRLASPADNSAALAAAVDRLNATVDRQAKIIDRQGRALEQIQKNTKRQADTLDIVTEGGKAMRSKEQQGSAA